MITEDKGSASSKSPYWMPNRSIHIEGAGIEELGSALALAFGGLKVAFYRYDASQPHGDRLILATDEKSIHALSGRERSNKTWTERVEGMICPIPPMAVNSLLGFVEGFLRAANPGPSPDCDGSVNPDAFNLRTMECWESWGVLVIVQPNWREFHK